MVALLFGLFCDSLVDFIVLFMAARSLQSWHFGGLAKLQSCGESLAGRSGGDGRSLFQ